MQLAVAVRLVNGGCDQQCSTDESTAADASGHEL